MCDDPEGSAQTLFGGLPARDGPGNAQTFIYLNSYMLAWDSVPGDR